MSLNGIADSSTTDKIIVNSNAFFPDIEVQAFIDVYRLPDQYNEPTLVQELKTAMYQVNEELIDYVLILQSVEASETLEDHNESLLHVYRTAVMATARAGLIKYFETANRKQAAEVQGDRGDVLKDVWTEAGHNAIDQLTRALMDAAEAQGALGKKPHFANGFRAKAI